MSSQWYGRLMGMLLIIARKNGLNIDTKSSTVLSLLEQVLPIADELEKSTINRLLEKINVSTNNGIESDEEKSKLTQTGFTEVIWLYNKYKSFNHALDDVDYFPEIQKEKEANEKFKRRSRIIKLSLFAIVVLGICLYKFFLSDYFMYKDVKNSKEVYMCKEYYSEYPEGWFYEEVMKIEMEISSSPISVYREYMQKFPDGKYTSTVKSEYEELWNKEIAKYEQRDMSNEDPELVEYIIALLKHLKENNISTVLLQVNQQIDLKDYSEYDEGIREIIEKSNTDISMPIEENMISLKENFTQGDKEMLYNILSEGVQNGFNKMFAEDFVKIVTNEYYAEENSPVLIFNYTVKNQSDVFDYFPEIWTYSINHVPQAYLLGIEVMFDVNFTIPDSNVSYSYSEIGNPGQEISNIQSIKDGYRVMTQYCFARFSNKISERMGLEKTY